MPARKMILNTVISESRDISMPEKITERDSAPPKMAELTNLFPLSFVRYRLKM